jgi:membrane-bound serine protease (ClpP class)
MSSSRIMRRKNTGRLFRPAFYGLLAILAALQIWLAPATTAQSQPDQAAPATALAEAPATQPSRYTKLAILPIDRDINDVTLESLKRRIAEAQEQGADLIVFEMDTPGGMVTSMLGISDAIKVIPQHTVAWIHTKAYSAGAIIALACKEIVMAPRSTIGDAMPISIGPEGPAPIAKDVAPKIISPLREELRESAQRNNYNVLLCLSMIQPDIEVFWVVSSETGEKRFVDRNERDRLFGIAATQPGAASQPVHAASRTEWTYVTSAPLIPNVSQPIVANDELLTMSQNEAIAYGFARPTMVSTVAELQNLYGIRAAPIRLESTWSENLVAWLTSPLIRGGILLIAMLAGYMELSSPGVGLPGAVAVLCLALFLGAPYLTGLADAWDILLVVLGLVLIAVEVFVLPGFGVAGVAGIVLLVVGLVASFVPAEWPDQSPFQLPSSDYAWQALRDGLLTVSLALIGSLIGMIVLSRYFRRMPYLSRLVLANPTSQETSLEGWFSNLPDAGQSGVSEGPLRPAGKARFGGKLIDVVAESDFIESGQPVQVIERIGNRVVVRQVTSR